MLIKVDCRWTNTNATKSSSDGSERLRTQKTPFKKGCVGLNQNIETKKKAFANSYQEFHSKRQRKRLYKAVFALILSQNRLIIKNGSDSDERI